MKEITLLKSTSGYIALLIFLAVLLVTSILVAVTIGSTSIPIEDVYQVIVNELSRVDLPLPFGPMTPTNCCGLAVREMLFMMLRPSMVTPTLSAEIFISCYLQIRMISLPLNK